MREAGYTREQAAYLVAQIEADAKPPYRLAMFGSLDDAPENYRPFTPKIEGMEFESLDGAYLRFRKFRPAQRWSILCLDAEAKGLLIDTAILEKAKGRKVIL